jgi:hypothetical protein
MRNFFLALLSLTLMLGACSPSVAPADSVRRVATEMTSPPIEDTSVAVITQSIPPSPNPKLIATLQTPHIDQPPDGMITTAAPTFEGCAYQWANQDLPELSIEFQQSIQSLQPEAQATAYAFGEDCIHADGSKSFIAKETDFNVIFQVSDLSNEAELGERIVKVMQVIENIPREKIMGPEPGRVSITFQTSSEQKIVNFYTNQYQSLPPGLSSAEIYQALQTPQ